MDLISRQAALDAIKKLEKPAPTAQHLSAIFDCEDTIKALPSAQPVVISKSENTTECEDAVSRFEVLRLIDYSSNDLNDSVDNRYFQGKVKELPSVTPKQPGWIPCSERMPEEPFACLVTVWDTNPVTMDEFENVLPYFVGWDGEQWNDANGEQCPFEVIAWQPLPEPWEGGQE